MRKRSHKRRPKRSGRPHSRQHSQQLNKQVRELYPQPASDQPLDSRKEGASPRDLAADGHAHGEDSDWADSLSETLEAQQHYRPRKRRRATKPSDSRQSEPLDNEQEQHGRVIAISSGACLVASGDATFSCILPSTLARDQKSALSIGDRVTFCHHGEKNHRVRRVLPRSSVLSRPDPLNPRRQRVIAANIDIAVHVASVIRPPLRPALVDRYLIAIERGGALPAVCVNKVDLLPDPAELQRELAPLAGYREMGVEVLTCSAHTGEGLAELRSLLTDKTAVFVGHSGVGKSSLLNALAPGLEAETGAVSAAHGRGQHTTTRSNLYQLSDGIEIIDTPGIREFGLWELSTQDLRSHFTDFEPFAARCRFANCSHVHEPNCGVRTAVDDGELRSMRYEAYLRILQSLEDPHRG